MATSIGFDVINMPRQGGCNFEEIPFSWEYPSNSVMMNEELVTDNVNTRSRGEKVMTGNPVVDSFDCPIPCAMSVGDNGNSDLSVFTSVVKDISSASHVAPQELAHAPSSSSSSCWSLTTSSSSTSQPLSTSVDSTVSAVQSKDLTRRSNSTTNTRPSQNSMEPLALPKFLMPTNFSTERPLAEITASIIGSFNDAEKFQFEAIPFDCSFVIKDDDELCFRINVYADTSTEKSVPRYVVEAQRLRGCAFAFTSVYESFKSSIVDTRHHLSVLTPSRATNLADVVEPAAKITEADVVTAVRSA